MKIGNGKQIVVACFVAIVALAWLFRHSVAVQYHKQAFRFALLTKSSRYLSHSEALVRLGYLQEREFPLKHRIISREFMRLVEATKFKDDYWTYWAPQSNMVSVTDLKEDMQLWEQIVSAFDTAEPGGPADGSQPLRSETNLIPVEAGSRR